MEYGNRDIFDKKDIQVFHNVNELINYLHKNNRELEFLVCKQDDKNSFADSQHPIVICDGKIYLDEEFYNKNLFFLKFERQKEIKSSHSKTLKIEEYILDDDFFNYLINNKYNSILYFDCDLTDKQIDDLNNKYIRAFIVNNEITKKVSTDTVIESYSKDTIKGKKALYITLPLSDHDVKGVDYIFHKADVFLRFSKFEHGKNTNESHDTYYDEIKDFIKLLPSKNYKLHIKCKNRKSLRDSNLLEECKFASSLYVGDDYEIYTKEDFLKEEEKLDSLVEPIKKANLSPYEKFIAAYNVAKNFKEYKENEKSPSDSRKIRKILNNDYMVCVGYAKLLQTLLERLDISSMNIGVKAETSPAYSEKMELGGHARLLVYLKDDKYGIDGYYVSDPTWDNDIRNDHYTHTLRTFYETSNERRAFSLEKEDVYLGAASSSDFDERINHKMKSDLFLRPKVTLKDILEEYYNIISDIQKIFYNLCDSDYEKIYESSTEGINFMTSCLEKDEVTEEEFKKCNEIFNKFMTEYKGYVIKKGNNIISEQMLFDVAKYVRSSVDAYSDKMLEIWDQFISVEMKERYNNNFPNMRM